MAKYLLQKVQRYQNEQREQQEEQNSSCSNLRPTIITILESNPDALKLMIGPAYVRPGFYAINIFINEKGKLHLHINCKYWASFNEQPVKIINNLVETLKDYWFNRQARLEEAKAEAEEEEETEELSATS